MLLLASQALLEDRFEGDRLVMVLIPRAIQERDWPAPDSFQQWGE